MIQSGAKWDAAFILESAIVDFVCRENAAINLVQEKIVAGEFAVPNLFARSTS